MRSPSPPTTTADLTLSDSDGWLERCSNHDRILSSPSPGVSEPDTRNRRGGAPGAPCLSASEEHQQCLASQEVRRAHESFHCGRSPPCAPHEAATFASSSAECAPWRRELRRRGREGRSEMPEPRAASRAAPSGSARSPALHCAQCGAWSGRLS
eukprot:scaffold282388_cov27-Tisochrysis_lutea.AAC.1